MKTNKQLLIGVAIMSFAFSNISYGQAVTTRTITLEVDTELLNNQNAAQVCTFTASSNTTVLANDPSNAENFTIEANVGDIIEWQGIAKQPSNDIINIRMIFAESGPPIFRDPFRSGSRGNGQADKVRDTIIAVTGFEVFKYKIFFKVGDTGAMYQIDPKIKVGDN